MVQVKGNTESLIVSSNNEYRCFVVVVNKYGQTNSVREELLELKN